MKITTTYADMSFLKATKPSSFTRAWIPILLLSPLLFSFADEPKREIDFLFYNLPLHASTNTIKNKIRADSNFTNVKYVRDHLFLRFLSASIAHPHTYTGQADSARFQMNLLSLFLYGNLGQSGPSLKSIELRIYFKNEASQKKEFESIEQALSTTYKLKEYREQLVVSSGPSGKDTVTEKGVLFTLDPNNKFPSLTLLQSDATATQRYVVLDYLNKNRN